MVTGRHDPVRGAAGAAVLLHSIAGDRPLSGRTVPSAERNLTMKPLLATALALSLTLGLTAPALALPPLAENSYLTDRLIAGRVADRIRTTCPSISGRLLRALSELHGLKKWALAQGYTSDEIEAFLGDKAEKDKLKARAEAYLTDNGATEGDAESFCAVGRQEIANGTIAGSLLYEN